MKRLRWPAAWSAELPRMVYLLEQESVAWAKLEGLQVSTPDLDAFHKTVQAAYQNSDYAKIWPKGLLERINATK
jgi:hypothetical protein